MCSGIRVVRWTGGRARTGPWSVPWFHSNEPAFSAEHLPVDGVAFRANQECDDIRDAGQTVRVPDDGRDRVDRYVTAAQLDGKHGGEHLHRALAHRVGGIVRRL